MEIPDMVASLKHTISAHSSDVNGVSFSKDKKLATCSGDKSVRLWDTTDFAELPPSPLCGHTYYVHSCVFSPFGTQLATCSTDGKVIVWDPASGKKTATFQHESKCPIRVIRFSPNSKFLLTGGDDNHLCLWNISTKSLVRTYQAHEGTVFGCDFSPDGNFIVSGSSDGDLQVWDAVYGHAKSLCMKIEGHDLGVTCCEFSPTFGLNKPDNLASYNFLLATTGQDDLVKLWYFISNPGTTDVILNEKCSLSGHTGSVMQCRFSLNGKLLASASSDKTVRLWDPINAVILQVIDGHKRYVTCCAFSSDGCLLATGSNDKTVMIWKLTTQEQLIADLKDEDEKYQENLIDFGEEVPGKTKRRPETWTVDEVGQWIVEIGLPEYEENFRKNQIDGQELVNLDQQSLERALGIEAYGHRNKILRCIFRLMEHPIVQQRDQGGLLDAGVPDEYLCPITREIMKDPVICTDGYTYERSAITSWMNKGKGQSPMTNAEFTSKELTPNRSLKMLIQRYLNPM